MLAIVALPAAVAAQTLTSGPTSGQTTLLPTRDYASYAWQDAWDMDKRTDLGWMTWGVDQPGHQMSSHGMSGCTSGVTGCQTFQFTPTEAAQPLYWLLDTYQTGASPVGRVGVRKPIATGLFKYLIIKMRITNSVSPSSYAQLSPPQMVIYWSRNTIYTGVPNGGILHSVTGGSNPGVLLDADGVEANQWQLYAIDLSTLQWWNQSTHPGSIVLEPASAGWGQPGITADSFFIQPINWPGSATGSMEIDWVQLAEHPGPAGLQLIKWTGGATSYDVVISPSSNCIGANQNSPDYTVVAENVTQSAGLSFPFASLPAGSYHVGLRSAGNDGPGIPRGAIALCSGGTYVVPGPSAFEFITPTDEGSTDDYASVFLNNPWDMDGYIDVDASNQVVSPIIDQSFPAQRPEGDLLGNIRVLRGTNSGDDPYIYPLWFNGRGKTRRIDPSRYRLVTIDMGVDADRDINAGSIARIVWHVAGDKNAQGFFLENVSQDIVFRHMRANANGGLFVLDHLQGDLLNTGSLPTEPGAPSSSGWTKQCISPYCTSPSFMPGIDGFRFDFHEFPQSIGLYVKQIKLAALERTGSSYQFSWVTSIPNISGASAVVKLYADRANVVGASPNGTSRNPIDPNCNPANLILLNGAGTSVSLGADKPGQFTWNPSSTPSVGTYNGSDGSGEYYICAQILLTANSQTLTTATVVTQFPILVDPSYVDRPKLYMDKTVLRYTAVYDRPSNSFIASTPDQTVGILQVGTGSASWNLDLRHADGSIPSYLKLSRTAGAGAGTFILGFDPAGLHAPPLPDCTAQDGLSSVLSLNTGGTTADDPQTIEVLVTIRPSAATSCSAMSGTPTQPPFGFFDIPPDGVTGQTGAVRVSGWALDDVAVARVEIWRSCVIAIDKACASATPGGSVDKIFIGNGTFLPGARTDAEAAFPTVPQAYNGGWGLLMLSNMLPHIPNQKPQGGQGQFTLYVYAVDVEGHYTQLGNGHRITLDNDHATQPFGTIDTPGEGGNVPGQGSYSNPNAYPNFAWAMAPFGKCIDVNSTASYHVFIDGVERPLVTNTNWFPGLQRSDLSTAFPGRCNTNNALAAYILNSGAFNLNIGMHTINWVVNDTTGVGASIGSRFFYLTSLGAGGSGDLIPAINGPIGSRVGQAADLLELYPLALADATATHIPNDRTETLARNAAGQRVLHADPTEVLQVDLPKTGGASPWEAYAVSGNRLWVLPLGASFDPEAGRFSWGPLAGFGGTHDFIFVRHRADGRLERLPLHLMYPSAGAIAVDGASR